MPDEHGNLYLFEAIELRNSYDRHIKLLEQVFADRQAKTGGLFRNDEEEREPSEGVDLKEIERSLKKLQTKRVKLNQAIQIANFQHHIAVQGDEVTLAEALELRKNMLADLAAMAQRVDNSAYKRIIHKEERDIVHEPRHTFQHSYDEYLKLLSAFRSLVTDIHRANHKVVVNFRDE